MNEIQLNREVTRRVPTITAGYSGGCRIHTGKAVKYCRTSAPAASAISEHLSKRLYTFSQ